LILRKTSKFDATRCQIFRLKCTKFYFRCGSAPETAGGSQRSPKPLALFKGPTSKGREEKRGMGRIRRGEGEGRGRGRKGGREEEEERNGKEGTPQIFWPRTAPSLLP